MDIYKKNIIYYAGNIHSHNISIVFAYIRARFYKGLHHTEYASTINTNKQITVQTIQSREWDSRPVIVTKTGTVSNFYEVLKGFYEE